MKINLLDLEQQYQNLETEIDSAIKNVLQKTNFILGENVKKLEKDIAAYIGVKHAIGVANGTDALLLALRALGVRSGDEVITTPFTFFASAETTSLLGATPVFVDIDERTFNLDAEKLESKITSKTKAIVPVHIFGQTCDMDKIISIAEKYNIPVIEDACQAIGSEYKGKKAGSIGKIAAFSFFPTKNLGCYGDGGMLVTDDDGLAEELRMLRSHGARVKYYHEKIGYNSRLDEIQAAILNVKFPHLDEWNLSRKRIADYYTEQLQDIPVRPQYEDININSKHIYHQYCIQVLEKSRDDLINYLSEHKISTAIYYPVPIHLFKAYENLNMKEGDYPVAEAVCKRILALPVYPELDKDKQDFIIKTIKEFYNK